MKSTELRNSLEVACQLLHGSTGLIMIATGRISSVQFSTFAHRLHRYHIQLKCHTATMFRPGIVPTRRFFSFKSLKPDFSRFKLIPQPAGHIMGTVNDAVPIRDPDHFHGSFHWSYERIVAISMVPLAVTPFVVATPYPLVDALFSTLILVHAHAGFQSCIIDYIPKRVYGIWHTIAMRVLMLGSVVGMYGIYEIETKDEGLTTIVKKLWTEPKPKPLSYF